MSQTAHNHNQSHLLVMDQMLRQEKDYHAGVEANQLLVQQNRLVGDNAQDVLELLQDDPDFVQKQHDRLKALTVQNQERTHSIDLFVQSLKNLRSSQSETDIDDFEQALTQELQRLEQSQPCPDPTKSQAYQELLEGLGESTANQNQDNQDNDDDDELQEIHQERSVKCPIMGSFLEEPMVSDKCGHAYSKAAILQYLGSRGTKACPVAGCPHHISQSNLQPDLALQQLVRRHKRRQSHQNKVLSQTAMSVDDDEDDE